MIALKEWFQVMRGVCKGLGRNESMVEKKR